MKYYVEYVLTHKPFWEKKRPKAVEKQIERYRKEKDKQKRKLIYQLICLEWIIVYENHLHFNRY